MPGNLRYPTRRGACAVMERSPRDRENSEVVDEESHQSRRFFSCLHDSLIGFDFVFQCLALCILKKKSRQFKGGLPTRRRAPGLGPHHLGCREVGGFVTPTK